MDDGVAVHQGEVRGRFSPYPSFSTSGIWFSVALERLIDAGVVRLTAHEQALLARQSDQRSQQGSGRALRATRAASREDAAAAGWAGLLNDNWPLKRRFAPRM